MPRTLDGTDSDVAVIYIPKELPKPLTPRSTPKQVRRHFAACIAEAASYHSTFPQHSTAIDEIDQLMKRYVEVLSL